jgi:hypothetical protein
VVSFDEPFRPVKAALLFPHPDEDFTGAGPGELIRPFAC